jgi:hypothetical protein
MKRIMIAILALMIGCFMVTGSGWATEKEMPNVGFLQDYSLLKPDDPEKMVQWVYTMKDVDVSKYHKIMLDDVVFFISDDAKYKGFEATELAELGGAFHRAMIMNLAGVYEFTDTPGPGVLRIRLAVTNLVPSGSVSGTVTTIVPVGLAISSVKKAATGSHIGMGSVSIEGEILDSQTNKVLGAVIDTKMGKKYKVRKGASKWGHAIDIFNTWAQNVRTRLDRRAGRIE